MSCARPVLCAINHKMRLGDDWQIRRVPQRNYHSERKKNERKKNNGKTGWMLMDVAVDLLTFRFWMNTEQSNAQTHIFRESCAKVYYQNTTHTHMDCTIFRFPFNPSIRCDDSEDNVAVDCVKTKWKYCVGWKMQSKHTHERGGSRSEMEKGLWLLANAWASASDRDGDRERSQAHPYEHAKCQPQSINVFIVYNNNAWLCGV